MAAVVSTPPGYTALVPVRICDTRAAGPGVVANQCDTGGHSPLGTAGTRAVTVAGASGVPADATAVVLHVTATGTGADSFLTVWPSGQARPTAASVNWAAGQTVSNLVQTGVGTGGQVNVFNYALGVDVIIDLQGYVEAGTGALYTPLTPTRVCDTRANQAANPCNIGGPASGTIGSGQTREINVASGFGVPAGATAVVLNVTATTTSAASFLTVWPTGAAQPLASSLNWAPGQTVSNRVITPVSAAGHIEVFNAHGTTDVVVDLGGFYTSTGSGFFPVAPLRICDTRASGPGVAINACDQQGQGTVGAGRAFALTNFNLTVTALVVNVTVTNTGAPGFLTIFPNDSTAIPLAADITWATQQTIGNLTVANLGSNGEMAIFNGSNGSTDVIIDVVGYYSKSATGSAAAAKSIFGAVTAHPVAGRHRQ